MKTLQKTIQAFGLLIQLSIDIIIGLTFTFAAIIIVYPFSFLYERLKLHYYKVKELISSK